MESNSKAKTRVILALIVLSSVGYKFFMGMAKVQYTVFTEATRYPSNIARDVLSLLCWFLIVERLKVHRCISAATFWAFNSVLITQILDYFLIGGQLGSYRLLAAPLVYILVSQWKKE